MAKSDLVARPKLDLPALAGVTAGISVFAVAQGLSYPLFTLLMQRQGMPPAMIGLSAAMTPLGLVVSAAFVPPAVKLVGARNLAAGCALLAAALFLSIGSLQNPVAWFGLRFLVGFAINPLYILSEVWAIALAPVSQRGRIMGVFTAVAGAGYATGPLALAMVGSDGWAPFLVGIAGFLLCALILFLTTGRLAAFEEETVEQGRGIGRFWRLAPALLLAVIISAACQQSAYSLFPVYGAAFGFRETTLARFVAMLSIGNVLLQIPLGLLAERFGARRMLLTCAGVNALSAALLPFLIETPAVWILLLSLGGIGYGIYTMALVELGERFSGSMLVAANAAFALMWGMGGIIGAPTSGLAIQLVGPHGMPIVIATLSATLVAFASYRTLRRPPEG
ncbi:MAG: MFS transporter [Methylobacterium mesophilicum]|nr:MFS transporter [Methylobacterium mesophilicum]